MKLTVINTILIVFLLVFVFLDKIMLAEKENEAYILTGELFQEFDYQKELNENYLALERKQNLTLDSIKNSLTNLRNSLTLEANDQQRIDFNKRVQDLEIIQRRFEEEKMSLGAESNKKIWDKLNALIKKYGQEHNLKVIFGTDGNGNILFAQDKLNITKEVIDYCNQTYNGN